MLDLIDESLEAFLRATVPLSATDVDVSFEPPERTWSAKLTRPTVNVFLWDIRRSTDRARSGVETLEHDGQIVRRMALPRIELRYLITAWTSDHGDERALLAGVMRTILAHFEIPETFIAEPLRELPPISILMARAGEEHLDVVKALEGQLKPSINMVLHTAVDTGVFTPAGPPLEELSLSLAEMDGSHRESRRLVAGEVRFEGAIGRAVTSPVGRATVNQAGRFLIPARPGDELLLDVTPPRTVVVGAAGGVVFA